MLTSRKPENRPEKKREYWDRLAVEPNAKHYAWVAGPCFGAWVHFVGDQSKPCCTMLTDSRVQCKYCSPGNKPVWRGYIPLYDSDYVRRFVVIGESYYEMASTLKHLEQVIVQRGKRKIDPVQIRPHTWRTAPIPATPDRQTPVDIKDFLVAVLWSDDALARWHFGFITSEAEKNAEAVATPQASEKPNPILDGPKRTIVDTITLALGGKAEEVDRVRKNKAFVAAAHASENGDGRHRKKRSE